MQLIESTINNNCTEGQERAHREARGLHPTNWQLSGCVCVCVCDRKPLRCGMNGSSSWSQRCRMGGGTGSESLEDRCGPGNGLRAAEVLIWTRRRTTSQTGDAGQTSLHRWKNNMRTTGSGMLGGEKWIWESFSDKSSDDRRRERQLK